MRWGGALLWGVSWSQSSGKLPGGIKPQSKSPSAHTMLTKHQGFTLCFYPGKLPWCVPLEGGFGS